MSVSVTPQKLHQSCDVSLRNVSKPCLVYSLYVQTHFIRENFYDLSIVTFIRTLRQFYLLKFCFKFVNCKVCQIFIVNNQICFVEGVVFWQFMVER